MPHSVKSRRRRKLRFSVRRPLKYRRELMETSLLSNNIKTCRSANPRVLVVDDNRDAADTLAQVLTYGRFEVETAYDGAQGVIKAKAFRPCAVILDLNMPLMDGFDAARYLKQDRRSYVLIALTGNTGASTTQQAEAAGFDVHIRKPADISTLVSLLERVAKGPDMRTSA